MAKPPAQAILAGRGSPDELGLIVRNIFELVHDVVHKDGYIFEGDWSRLYVELPLDPDRTYTLKKFEVKLFWLLRIDTFYRLETEPYIWEGECENGSD